MALIPGTQYNIVSISDLRNPATELIKTGFEKGLECGFNNAKDAFSFRKKYHTVIYGPPHHGKSQVVKEIAINLSNKYGTKHLMRVPEWGSPTEGYVDLIQTYLGKKLFDNDRQPVSDKEVTEAIDFIHSYFRFLVQQRGNKASVIDDFNAVEMLQQRKKFSPEMLWVDHFRWWGKPEIWRNYPTEDYVTETMQTMTLRSDELDIHTVLLNHTSQMDLKEDKDTGKRYIPKPTFFEMAGGQSFSKFGQQILCIYRPTEGVVDKDTNEPFRKNQLVISVDKSVPKGTGETGKQVTWFFDKNKQRFYEEANTGEFYAFEYEKQKGTKPFTPPPLPTEGSKLSFKWDNDEEAPF